MISQFMILPHNKSPQLLQQTLDTEAQEEQRRRVRPCSGPRALWAQGRVGIKKAERQHRERGGELGDTGALGHDSG